MSKIPMNFLACMMTLAMLILGAESETFAEPYADIAMVTVGNAGNAADSSGYGSVAYQYRIGTYDVTISQYAEFLNAVAATDTYGLYNENMATNLNIAGISRSGASGSYTYGVIGSSGNKPVTYVSWFDSARFANWVANGQPTGAQNATTTENGAYDLNGAIFGNAPVKNATNPNTGSTPSFYLPDENEWYKAAYYKGGSANAGYWLYATGSDAAPGNVIGASANQANWSRNDVYSVTQSTDYVFSQNYLSDVGAYSSSSSPYGTFDQSGNVYQWIDTEFGSADSRIYRGGRYVDNDAFRLSSANRLGNPTSTEESYIGFRLAAPMPVPEPSTFALAAAATAILAFRSRSVRQARRQR